MQSHHQSVIKKIILAPDSFKGTMSAVRVCEIMAGSIRPHLPDATLCSLPLADGGEGTVEAFLRAAGGKRISVTVQGPWFEPINSFYAILADDRTAVIEMAAAAGLELVGEKKNPALTTTYGVGELIAHAIHQGCKQIILGMGGSATNDGGAGLAAALGIKFLDRAGMEFVPTGASLDRIARIDISGKISGLEECTVIAICDVDNPLHGENGAAFVYAPQKGADAAMVRMLDKNLRHLAQIIQRDCGLDVRSLPGAGAAGGLGAGAAAFLNASLKPGIDIVLDAVAFDEHLKDADYVFTGEGRIDSQSLSGKAVAGIARRAKLKNVPVIVIAGEIGAGIDELYRQGVLAVVCTNRGGLPFSEALATCEQDLAETVDRLMRILTACPADRPLTRKEIETKIQG